MPNVKTFAKAPDIIIRSRKKLNTFLILSLNNFAFFIILLINTMDLNAPIVHICDPPKLEFDELLRNYSYGHDGPVTHISRGSWGASRY